MRASATAIIILLRTIYTPFTKGVEINYHTLEIGPTETSFFFLEFHTLNMRLNALKVEIFEYLDYKVTHEKRTPETDYKITSIENFIKHFNWKQFVITAFYNQLNK